MGSYLWRSLVTKILTQTCLEAIQVTKQKMNVERDAGKLRITSSALCDELDTIKSELHFFTRQLEESKSQISNARHQIAMIDICTSSERSKVSSHVEHLNAHREGYNDLFNKGMCKETDKLEVLENINKIKSLERKELRTENQYLEEICEVTERAVSEVREKELREKESEELESERQKLKMAAARNEQRAREAAAFDAESDAIEQASVVLKKRNNAIMLKLRRKLVETEDIRRELLKIKEHSDGHHNLQ